MESSKETTDEMSLSASSKLTSPESSAVESKGPNVKRRQPEASPPSQERVEMIHKNDILFGRGKGFQNYS